MRVCCAAPGKKHVQNYLWTGQDAKKLICLKFDWTDHFDDDR